jgi:hypothetical protein
MSNPRKASEIIGQFTEWTEERCRTDFSYQLLFRGVSSIDYSLLPSGWRDNFHFRAGDKEMREYLIDHLYLWAEDAATIDSNVKSLNILDLMALAQHYNFPTLLLDWTTNPMVALLFSIINIEEKKEDAIVYSFAPKGEVWHKDEGIEAKNKIDIKITPLLYRPPIFDKRIQVQSGVFTYHHSESSDIKNLYGRELITRGGYDFKTLDTFSIKQNEGVSLRNHIRSIGMHNFFVKPDLEGLSEYYKKMMKTSYRLGYLIPKKSPSDNYVKDLLSSITGNRPMP